MTCACASVIALWLTEPAAASPTSATSRLRDDGIYQNGGYWATPLPWLMEVLAQADPALAARVFCETVEDFQSRQEVNEWVNEHAGRRSAAHAYCASAAMPLAGATRLRRFLKASGQTLPPDLAARFTTAESWLRTRARGILRDASQVAKDGVRIFTPDASGRYRAFWVRDWSYAIEGCPEAFTPAEIRAGYLFLAAAQRADGCMPDRVGADGRGVFSPGNEAKPFSRNGSVDQSPFMVILCHQYWKLTGDLAPFRQTAGALEQAMHFTPRNPDNGLVRIDDAAEFRPYSFLDTVALTGDQQFDSVLFVDAGRKLAELFAADGQPQRAESWRHEAARVQGSLATLWDEPTGLFVAASRNWRQPAVWGSLFAVYAGCTTPEQTRRIVRSCVEGLPNLVSHGQLRHLPRGMYWGRPGLEYEPVPASVSSKPPIPEI